MKTIGQMAYETFGDICSYKTYTGKQMLLWEQLSEREQMYWQVGATAGNSYFINEQTESDRICFKYKNFLLEKNFLHG